MEIAKPQFFTPILIINFNRPNHTQRVWDEIKKQKPKQVFIFQDGPREENSDDVGKCSLVRKIFDENLDWECDIKTNYSDVNLGCGYGPSKAINWFFENVSQGIILEDDCLPSQSFFMFCEDLLIRYKEDSRIGMISGYNPLLSWYPNKKDYIYSRLGGCWGWATWSSSWSEFDYSAQKWCKPETKMNVQRTLKYKSFYEHFYKDFNFYFAVERRDVWDYQWVLSRLNAGKYTIVPSINLISNIGTGIESTHTPNIKVLPLFEYKKNELRHYSLKIDTLFDWLFFHRFINSTPRSFFKRVTLKLLKIITGTDN